METDDNSWVFDSLIGFLNGPVWNGPLQSFIEEKSIIFEANNADNKEYRVVHDEFKHLVDLMLGTYMEDIGITPDQFEIACNSGMHEKLPTEFQDNLFEQIWAANDFEIFKRMMTQKNIELQIQALELIEQKYGIMPQLFIPDKEPQKELKEESDEPVSRMGEAASSEKEVMVEVIRQCEPEEVSTDAAVIPVEEAFIREEKQILEQSLEKTDDKIENVDLSTREITEVNDEDILKRQEYLKAQRDKLVALKKQVRKKHLQEEMEHLETNNARPQSAKTAEAVMTGEMSIEPETLKIRKALAQRLRSEVIAKTSK